MSRKTISPKWSELALSVLGDKDGRHCHWCKFIKTDDNEAHCINKESPYCDGDRIRTWDGLECATLCTVFELSDWYTSDTNFVKYFGKEER